MNRKSRRRMTMAVGATIAGAAIPIAAACNAWANTEITYDGIILYDDFTGAPTIGTSDVGTAAESGTNNDWAIVSAPASEGTTLLANDSGAGDANDFAYYQSSTAPNSFFGTEGALITNATNSNAEVYGGGNAVINDFAPQYGAHPGLVTDSTAVASNGGTALIGNDGNEASLTTMTGDFADANGTATNTLADGHTTGLTTTVAEILDSNNSMSSANDTGFNFSTLEGGSAVDLANNSDAYATNPGSAANIEGGVVNGVPLTNDVPITGVSNVEPDGDVFTAFTSNMGYIDGIPDATFFADLFGAGGPAAFTADWTIVGQLFGL